MTIDTLDQLIEVLQTYRSNFPDSNVQVVTKDSTFTIEGISMTEGAIEIEVEER